MADDPAILRPAGAAVVLALFLAGPGCGGPARTPRGEEGAATAEASGASANAAARIAILVGGHPARVEVVSTPEDRERGLMFRDSLDPDTGMLFVFSDEAPRSFWMKNTRIPLSIAYLRSDGTIVEILDMEPMTTVSHPSRLPARFALEMAQGWFAERYIRPGDGVELPPAVLERPAR